MALLELLATVARARRVAAHLASLANLDSDGPALLTCGASAGVGMIVVPRRSIHISRSPDFRWITYYSLLIISQKTMPLKRTDPHLIYRNITVLKYPGEATAHRILKLIQTRAGVVEFF